MAVVPPVKKNPYDQWSPATRALDLVGDKWTLLIIRDLLTGPRRFVHLQHVLPGISTEQLRSRLNRMVADGLLTRQRFRETPPRVEYSLTERAAALQPVIAALAEWGIDWAWGLPKEGERKDVFVIFRDLLGRIDARRLGASAVTCVVGDRTAVFGGEGLEVTLEEEVPKTWSVIAGTEEEWIKFLSGSDAESPRPNDVHAGKLLAELRRLVVPGIQQPAELLEERAA